MVVTKVFAVQSDSGTVEGKKNRRIPWKEAKKSSRDGRAGRSFLKEPMGDQSTYLEGVEYQSLLRPQKMSDFQFCQDLP